LIWVGATSNSGICQSAGRRDFPLLAASIASASGTTSMPAASV
jgi:hypothetical protein